MTTSTDRMARTPAYLPATSASTTDARDSGDSLEQRYRRVRSFTEQLCAPLATEDFVVQSAPEVSPTKWRLAHTNWFFETFVLDRWIEDYRPFDPAYRVLFNSYYDAVGMQFPKVHRGTLSRPTVQDVKEYRDYVDDHMSVLLLERSPRDADALTELTVLGLHHEQQHQELMLTDIKHVYGTNPLHPAYRDDLRNAPKQDAPPLRWFAKRRVPLPIARVRRSATSTRPRHSA